MSMSEEQKAKKKLYWQEYRKNNREKMNEYAKKYRDANREKVRESARLSARKRKAERAEDAGNDI